MTYNLLSERINVIHRSVGHLRAMAREADNEVERMELEFLAKAMAKVSNRQIARVGVR